ncbi:phage portal protein [Microbacterium paludicola]|nr:phage portal protein [Microbacterium paludicola]
MTFVSLASSGNAYWRVKRDDRDQVTNVEVMNPLDVVPVTSASGRITGYQYQQNDKPIPVREVEHLKLLRVPGKSTGLGPIQAAQRELRGAIDVRDYASHWFRDSGVPSGVLKTDAPMSDVDVTAVRNVWNSTPAGQVRVLSDSLDYVPLLLNPEDAQWIENRKYSTSQIASLFGIPAGLMNAPVEGNSMTYSNIAQSWTEFARFTLQGYTREIETALSNLLPRGQYVRFNLEALLRPDTKTRYEMHSLAMNAGWMTANDVRKIEGLEPLDGGNELRKPSATNTSEAIDA